MNFIKSAQLLSLYLLVCENSDSVDGLSRYVRTKWIEHAPVTIKEFSNFRVLGRGGFGVVTICSVFMSVLSLCSERCDDKPFRSSSFPSSFLFFHFTQCTLVGFDELLLACCKETSRPIYCSPLIGFYTSCGHEAFCLICLRCMPAGSTTVVLYMR